jgi:hypothetical protein
LRDLWVVGDIHGAHDKLRAILLRAGLVDFEGHWAAGNARVVFLGDYVDRGPKGVEVIGLIRRLQAQARRSGGEVTALLGNHEVMFLAALLFGHDDPQDRLGFRQYWQRNGGQERDLRRLTPEDLAWMLGLPMLAVLDGWLMVHADSLMYLKLGGTVEAVNARVRAVLAGRDGAAWARFLNAFAARMAFSVAGGEAAAHRMLGAFGGEHLAHGHTPVHVLLDEQRHGRVRGAGAPLPYAGRLCVAMDSGMAYRPDAGFIARLDGGGVAQVVCFPDGEPV